MVQPPNVVPTPPPQHSAHPLARNDKEFIDQVESLRRMKNFLIHRGVELKDADREALVNLGYLNSLYFNPVADRPTNDDWRNLDTARYTLSAYLTGDLKTRFQLRLAPRFLFWLPVVFSVIIVGSLAIMFFPPDYSLGEKLFGVVPSVARDTVQQGWFLAGWICWSIGLGGLGSIVFLYLNALSIENDTTVDVSDRGFVTMRIIVGALFGFVLGLPSMLAQAQGNTVAWVRQTDELVNALILVSPFVYGFSTPLVIAVMNRIIETIHGLFGIKK